ncbi:chorismate mutase [Treponema pedis]|uniref:chorismate mutase n=1 Tax=Treponema pedis str. T A4 TaxID=1291379 RepID=S5ZXS0_9SPIR|nr:chorismate mutase [Treponema pedis]AGT42763.1 chorismate mutase [Treponema pedis str. T A4]
MILKKLKAVRGAVTCENSTESIQKEVCFLFSEILKLNRLREKDIVSIQFTVTKDITALNPATALRKNGFAKDLALFCSAEPETENSLPNTVRLLIHYYSRLKPVYVYLNGAANLRK